MVDSFEGLHNLLFYPHCKRIKSEKGKNLKNLDIVIRARKCNRFKKLQTYSWTTEQNSKQQKIYSNSFIKREDISIEKHKNFRI